MPAILTEEKTRRELSPIFSFLVDTPERAEIALTR
jgi:hypothetical protein